MRDKDEDKAQRQAWCDYVQMETELKKRKDGSRDFSLHTTRRIVHLQDDHHRPNEGSVAEGSCRSTLCEQRDGKTAE